MHMKEVVSSYLHSVGYDPATRELQVQFNTGAHFAYADVPPEVHAEMMADDQPSIGKFFTQRIKGIYAESNVKLRDRGSEAGAEATAAA